MGEKPDVIRNQMDETRASLSEKLGELENTLVGTVKDVTHTATDTVENVKETVEETVDTVGEAVHDSVETVKGAFDIPNHVQNYPWPALGVALAVGFFAGRMIHPPTEYRRRRRRRRGGIPHNLTTNGARESNGHAQQAQQDRGDKGESMLDGVGQVMKTVLSSFKGLAVGAALGVVRDMLTDAAPDSLRSKLGEIMDQATGKLGGEPVNGPVVGSGNHEDETEGDSNAKRNESEVGRSVGAADRKGKKPVGQSHR